MYEKSIDENQMEFNAFLEICIEDACKDKDDNDLDTAPEEQLGPKSRTHEENFWNVLKNRWLWS